MNTLEAKRQNRAERYLELAAKHERLSELRHKAQRAILDCIPLGQPILVGHHRADLNRVDRHMAKAIEHADKAKYYRQRAATIESNIRRLRERLGSG